MFRCHLFVDMHWRDINIPATSQTPADEAGPRPQNISGDVREVMGLLSLTVRAQVVALSSVPTQRSCHVEWAETEATVARRTRADFMLAVGSRKGWRRIAKEW